MKNSIDTFGTAKVLQKFVDFLRDKNILLTKFAYNRDSYETVDETPLIWEFIDSETVGFDDNGNMIKESK